MLLPACGQGSSTSGHAARTKVVLATGFPTSMNFAPYYLAQARGYYARQGLDVTIRDGANTGLLEQVGRGQIDFGVTTGDSLLLAAAAGVPDVMVMQQFTSNPVGAISLASGTVSLHSPADLRGLRVGVSAPNGSTYFGLLALLASAGLTVNDVDVVSVGFTELEALSAGHVDAAMTYLNNEPTEAASQGIPVRTLPVSRYRNLVSQGLVTSEQNVKDRPGLVRRFVRATVEGLRTALSDPAAAASASLARMSGLTTQERTLQRRILTATQPYEKRQAPHPLGWTAPGAWTSTATLLRNTGILKGNVMARTCYTNQFVGG